MGRWQNNTIWYKKAKASAKYKPEYSWEHEEQHRDAGIQIETGGASQTEQMDSDNRQREEMKSKTYDTRAQTFKIKHKITKAVPGSQADESSEAVELQKTKTISSNMLKKTSDSSGELPELVVGPQLEVALVLINSVLLI